jgi:hypothetical protein
VFKLAVTLGQPLLLLLLLLLLSSSLIAKNMVSPSSSDNKIKEWQNLSQRT